MQDKNKLIKAAKKTFFAYLKLDFAREFHLNINGNKTSFTDYVQELLENETLSLENTEHACTIGEKAYIIELKNNKITLRTDPPSRAIKAPYKDITEYDEKDVCELLSNTKFTVGLDKNDNLSLSLPTIVNGKPVELGGPTKLPLYRSHLVTLRKMVSHLEEHDDIKAMLVALTTGSGKTFVQGLWYLTLQFAKMGGIFGQPHNLVEQFRSDLKKLLPDELVDELQSADHMGKDPFILDSYETLLDHHFEELYDEEAEASDQVLIFDEQHQVMGDESRRVKLKALAAQKLCLFLTATPTKETFKMCDNHPVAVMSAMEKQLEGQGSFPKVVKLQNQSLLKIANSLVMTKLERLTSYISIPLRSVFEGKYNPPTAWTVFEDLSTRVHIKNEAIPNDHSRAYLRQNLEMPGRHKMLFITDSTDELINIWNYIGNKHHYNLSPYVNGGNEHQTHGPSDKQYQSVVQRHNNAQNAKFRNQLLNLDPNGFIDPNNTKNYDGTKSHKPIHIREQLDKTIYHNMIDLFLGQITGLSPLELNRHREEDLAKLIELVNKKFDPTLHLSSNFFEAKLRYDAETNPNGIDANGAAQVADILLYMAREFNYMEEDTKQRFIDNWAFDDTDYDQLKKSFLGLDNFCKNHRMMFIMKGKKTAETPIEDDEVFFDFETKEVHVFDDNRMLSKEAKKRKRATFEVMDENLKETHYVPMVNPDITQAIADNYFKLGLVGMYVSNNKWQGFNDIGLHTVISTIPTPNDANNAPARMIQTIGRNRGLDPTITPYFIQCFGLDCKSTFDVKLLETTDDYYKLYFSAEKKYQKLFIQQLAKLVAAEIKHELYNNPTGKLMVNDLRLKWGTLRCVAKALRELNNKNAHNIQLSRSQLSTVIRLVKKELAQDINVLKKSSDLPPSIMRIFSAVYTFFSTFTYLANIKVKYKIFQKTLESKRALKAAVEEDNQAKIVKHQAELLYAKILRPRYSTIGAQAFGIQTITTSIMTVVAKIKDGEEKPEDESSLREIIINQLRNYIMHPQFYKTAKIIAGAFSESELQFLINVLQDKNPAEKNQDATDLCRFLSLLKDKNYELIAEEFLGLDNPKLFSSMLPLLNEIQSECESIHKFYLRLKGNPNDPEDESEEAPKTMTSMATAPSFKLHSLLGDKGITTLKISPTGNKTFNELRQDAMTWYPMLSGVAVGSKVSVLQHSEEIKVLQRINKHILTPLWWSTNKTKLELKISEWVDSLKAMFSFSKNSDSTKDYEPETAEVDNSEDSYSTITQSIQKSEQPSISDAEIDEQFNKAAYETGRQIRQLKQFSLKQVRKPDCKIDTVQKVLDFIDEGETTLLNAKGG